MGNSTIRRMTLDGVLIALFLVLSLLPLRFGNFLVIGVNTIVITIAAICLSPIDALLIAAIGETLNQIFFSGYGITPTTPLWVLPVVVRAGIIALVAWLYRRKGDDLTNHKVLYFVTIMGTALVISLLDTGLLHLDGLIMGYPVAFVWAQTGIRFGTSQLTAFVVALIALPLRKAVDFFLPAPKRKEGPKDPSQKE